MIDVSKSYKPIVLKYHCDEFNTPLYDFTQTLVAHLHITVLEKILNGTDFNHEVRTFELNIRDLNSIFDLIEDHHRTIPKMISSIEYSFNHESYMLNVLISGDSEVYYFKIKLSKELFVDGARQLAKHLNELYENPDDLIVLDYEKITKKLSGEHITMNFSSFVGN